MRNSATTRNNYSWKHHLYRQLLLFYDILLDIARLFHSISNQIQVFPRRSCVISYIQDISLLQQQEENIRELDEIENIEKQSERQGRWTRVGEMRREFMIVVIHAKCN